MYNKIKQTQLEARKPKTHNKKLADLMTYVLGEVGRSKDKDTSDKAVTEILVRIKNKLKKSIDETDEKCSKLLEKVLSKSEQEKLINDRDNLIADMHEEIELISHILPDEMSEDDLHDLLIDIVSKQETPNIGSVMKELNVFIKNNPQVLIDRGSASKLIKKLI